MAVGVVWAATAQKERNEILQFYRKRHGDSRYSKEFARHFNASMALVVAQELMGRPTDLPGVRCLLVL